MSQISACKDLKRAPVGQRWLRGLRLLLAAATLTTALALPGAVSARELLSTDDGVRPTVPAVVEVLGEADSSQPASAGALATGLDLALEPLEGRLYDLLNRERAGKGLAPLQLEPRLVALARLRSADMASRNYFAHVTPEGQMVFEMMDQRQIRYRLAGENLARNNYPRAESAEVAHRGFINSPSHAENALDPTFNRVGLGVAVANDGAMIYFTVLFAAMD